jgi:hypothetical protein
MLNLTKHAMLEYKTLMLKMVEDNVEVVIA